MKKKVKYRDMEEILEKQNGMQRSMSAVTLLNTCGRSIMFDEENLVDTQQRLLHNDMINGQLSGEIMFEESRDARNPMAVLEPKLRCNEVWSPRLNAGLSDIDRKEFFVDYEPYSREQSFSNEYIVNKKKVTKNKIIYGSCLNEDAISLKSNTDLEDNENSSKLDEKISKPITRNSLNDRIGSIDSKHERRVSFYGSKNLDQKLSKSVTRNSSKNNINKKEIEKSSKEEIFTTMSLNSYSSGSEEGQTDSDDSSDSSEDVESCLFNCLVNLGSNSNGCQDTNGFRQAFNKIRPGEEPEGFVNPDPNFKGQMLIFTYAKDTKINTDKKDESNYNDKNQVKVTTTEKNEKILKAEENTKNIFDEIKLQVSNAEVMYKEKVEKAKLSKKLFIEALEANFQKENTDEKINLFKERECYEKSILEMNEAETAYKNLIEQNGMLDIAFEKYTFESASVIESRYKFEPVKNENKDTDHNVIDNKDTENKDIENKDIEQQDVKHKVSKNNLKISENKQKKRKITKKKISNNKSNELSENHTCPTMDILKTVDGQMDRIFEKLPFEEFNKLQSYFYKSQQPPEKKYPFGRRKNFQKKTKTLVEKHEESVTKIQQWKVEEKISKKKNPLYCCSLFDKYCNKINKCRPKSHNYGPAKLRTMVKKLENILDEDYKASHPSKKLSSSNSLKEDDVNSPGCNKTFNKVKQFRKKDKYDTDSEHEYLDGQKDFRQIFKMNAFRSLVPILTNLQLGKIKDLVSPIELLQAVKECKIKGEELNFGLATEITNEWNQDRVISVDEALFAIHKPSEYINLCENFNPEQRDYEIYEWTVNKKTFKKKLNPFIEKNIYVGTLDGRVPGVMAKEFKKTLKNFKRDPEMDKYVESPFNPFNEASEMTGICFDINKFTKLLAPVVEPVNLKKGKTGNDKFYDQIEKIYNAGKEIREAERLPKPSSAAKKVTHSNSKFSCYKFNEDVYKQKNAIKPNAYKKHRILRSNKAEEGCCKNLTETSCFIRKKDLLQNLKLKNWIDSSKSFKQSANNYSIGHNAILKKEKQQTHQKLPQILV